MMRERRNRMVRCAVSFGLALALVAGAGAASGEAARIYINGRFDDWEGVSPVYEDASGDQASGDIDFGRLYITNDEKWLHLSLEVGTEVNIQGDNLISIFFDTDNDASTGQPWHGLGAEVGWTFGNRIGFFVVDIYTYNIRSQHIGLVTAPTVTGERFEFCFERSIEPLLGFPLFPEDTVRVAVADSRGGDVVPDEGGSIVYVFDDTPLTPLVPASIRKKDPGHVRFLSYNVLFDGIFETGRRRSFDRIFNAVLPDIVGFQEIYSHTAEETRDLVDGFLPAYGPWYGAKAGQDIIAVSRYPIVGSHAIGTNGAFLIDLGDEHASQVLMIAAHPPCCDNDEGRQLEIDAIMAFLRESKSSGGPLEVAPETPVVILGDMNLVGDRQQLGTLLTGEIVNTSIYGPWFDPDWDGTDLADALPLHTDAPMAFTWQDFESSYWPGRLDFTVYTDAVMDLAGGFVLSTREMHADTLAAFGLLEDDTAVASDHLPVVSDFVIYEAEPEPGAESFASPNPARGGTTAIVFGKRFIGVPKHVTYYDIRGRKVSSGSAEADDELLIWDGRNSEGRTVAPGIYLAVIEGGSASETVKVVYLR
jgi:hypothetical protein